MSSSLCGDLKMYTCFGSGFFLLLRRLGIRRLTLFVACAGFAPNRLLDFAFQSDWVWTARALVGWLHTTPDLQLEVIHVGQTFVAPSNPLYALLRF